MPESYFNKEQRAYMDYIFQVPRDQRCSCGWHLLGECNYPDCLKAYAASKVREAPADAHK
jgi:hypothetical protein